MTYEKQMSNKETAAHLREWVKTIHGPFAWPTDACGYNQSVRFAQHRNENFKSQDMTQFILDYADQIENEPDTVCLCIHPNVKVTHTCYCCHEPSCQFNRRNMDGTVFS